jgi:hypothetical protein
MQLKSHDVTWINLKIVAQVPPFCRLNTQDELFAIEPYRWYTAITRWVRGASRSCCVHRIDELMEDVRTMCEGGIACTERLLTHLRGAEKGIGNLKRTYDGDHTTMSSLDHILDKIQVLTNTYCTGGS